MRDVKNVSYILEKVQIETKRKILRELNNKDEFEEIAYWRKANQIHNFFAERLGINDCERYQVSKELLIELLELVIKVLDNHNLAEELLPTCSGFFFGDTEYDDYYFKDLEDTKIFMEKILKETDFENEMIYYLASW